MKLVIMHKYWADWYRWGVLLKSCHYYYRFFTDRLHLWQQTWHWQQKVVNVNVNWRDVGVYISSALAGSDYVTSRMRHRLWIEEAALVLENSECTPWLRFVGKEIVDLYIVVLPRAKSNEAQEDAHRRLRLTVEGKFTWWSFRLSATCCTPIRYFAIYTVSLTS